MQSSNWFDYGNPVDAKTLVSLCYLLESLQINNSYHTTELKQLIIKKYMLRKAWLNL